MSVAYTDEESHPVGDPSAQGRLDTAQLTWPTKEATQSRMALELSDFRMTVRALDRSSPWSCKSCLRESHSVTQCVAAIDRMECSQCCT